MIGLQLSTTMKSIPCLALNFKFLKSSQMVNLSSYLRGQALPTLNVGMKQNLPLQSLITRNKHKDTKEKLC